MQIVLLVMQLIGSIAALAAIYTTVRACSAPMSVLEWLDKANSKRDAGRKTAQILLVVNFVGFAVLATGGIDNALAWLPHSVGNFGDGGEFTSARTAISITLGLMVAYPIFSFVSRLAELQAKANKGESRK